MLNQFIFQRTSTHLYQVQAKAYLLLIQHQHGNHLLLQIYRALSICHKLLVLIPS